VVRGELFPSEILERDRKQAEVLKAKPRARRISITNIYSDRIQWGYSMTAEISERSSNQFEQFPKQTYAAPKLIQYGSLRQITLSAGKPIKHDGWCFPHHCQKGTQW
jgi:hypothetical protein